MIHCLASSCQPLLPRTPCLPGAPPAPCQPLPPRTPCPQKHPLLLASPCPQDPLPPPALGQKHPLPPCQPPPPRTPWPHDPFARSTPCQHQPPADHAPTPPPPHAAQHPLPPAAYTREAVGGSIVARAVREQHFEALQSANPAAVQLVEEYTSTCLKRYWQDWVGSQPLAPLCVWLVSVSRQLLQVKPDTNLTIVRAGLTKSETSLRKALAGSGTLEVPPVLAAPVATSPAATEASPTKKGGVEQAFVPLVPVKFSSDGTAVEDSALWQSEVGLVVGSRVQLREAGGGRVGSIVEFSTEHARVEWGSPEDATMVTLADLIPSKDTLEDACSEKGSPSEKAPKKALKDSSTNPLETLPEGLEWVPVSATNSRTAQRYILYTTLYQMHTASTSDQECLRFSTEDGRARCFATRAIRAGDLCLVPFTTDVRESAVSGTRMTKEGVVATMRVDGSPDSTSLLLGQPKGEFPGLQHTAVAEGSESPPGLLIPFWFLLGTQAADNGVRLVINKAALYPALGPASYRWCEAGPKMKRLKSTKVCIEIHLMTNDRDIEAGTELWAAK